MKFDTYTDRILRDRHIARLQEMADSYDDEAYEHASHGRQRRAEYVQWWAGRAQADIEVAQSEPLRCLFGVGVS